MNGGLPEECHLLLLPDGRLLVRNLTPELNSLLAALQPDNPDLALRAAHPEPTGPETHLLSDP